MAWFPRHDVESADCSLSSRRLPGVDALPRGHRGRDGALVMGGAVDRTISNIRIWGWRQRVAART